MVAKRHVKGLYVWVQCDVATAPVKSAATSRRRHACLFNDLFRDKKRSPSRSTTSPAAQGYIDAGPHALLVPTASVLCPCPLGHHGVFTSRQDEA
eukprot:353108-Chlamydomonas_euryale.AAC.7